MRLLGPTSALRVKYLTLEPFLKAKEKKEKEVDEETRRRIIIRYLLKKYGYLDDDND